MDFSLKNHKKFKDSKTSRNFRKVKNLEKRF